MTGFLKRCGYGEREAEGTELFPKRNKFQMVSIKEGKLVAIRCIS
jgi:hypothetical protein